MGPQTQKQETKSVTAKPESLSPRSPSHREARSLSPRSPWGGREIRYAAAEAEEMRAVIRDRLRRRLTAPKRIGRPYRLAVFNAAPGFDASAWLPGEVMAEFFQAA